MQAYSKHTLVFLIAAVGLLSLAMPNPVQQLAQKRQAGIFTDSTKIDSLRKRKSPLNDVVSYKAKDSVVIYRRQNKVALFNQSEVNYTDTKLQAGKNIINYNRTEVSSAGIQDSIGEMSQTPIFQQGNQVIEPDSIRFNYISKRALIYTPYTNQGENNIKAQVIKKENDSVYFMKNGIITTAENLDDPDYYILVRNAKFIPKKRIIAGFSNMYIADVPTPIALPFAYYPMINSRTSGVLFPTFGQINDRGYYLQNGGYYFAISNYFDLALTADYYTNGSYGIRTASAYKKRYKYSGNVSLRYENTIQSQKGFPDYSRSSVYNIQWSHSQDGKSSPLSSFSASVNLGSSSYYRDSFNQLNSSNFLNNTLSSSVSYSRTFPAYPQMNLSLSASHSQNTNTKRIDMTLPALRLSMERIYPFVKRGSPKKGLIQNLNLSYSSQADNRYTTTDELFFQKQMFQNALTGLRHSIPLSTNFKVMKHLSLNMNAALNETWQFKTIRYSNYDPTLLQAKKDTISGFDRFLTYNFGAGAGTTIYGTFDFGKNKKIQAIRHVMRPSVSYGYTPSFDHYYDYYTADAYGNQRHYTRFEGGIFGSPSKSESNSMSFSVSNTFEAKVRPKDSTATQPKKVMLLNSLNFGSNYNFLEEKFSPVSLTGGTQLFNSKLGVNFGATLNPYAIDNQGKEMKAYNIAHKGSLFRLTNANLTMNYAFSSQNFKKKKSSDSSASGGRNDDLFGSALEDTIGENTETNAHTSTQEKENQDEKEKTRYYYASMPWDLRLAYSLSYTNYNRNPMFSTNSLMISGNIDLTPQWRIGISTGYDFKDMGLTYTQLRFERDLGSFRMSFNITPIGYRSSWNFFIGIKASMLSDLKYERTEPPQRRR